MEADGIPANDFACRSGAVLTAAYLHAASPARRRGGTPRHADLRIPPLHRHAGSNQQGTTMRSTVFAALCLLVSAPDGAFAQDADAGEKVFVKCRVCHQ